MLKYLLLWIPMILVAIANAALREGVLKTFADELLAHQLSTATGIVFFGVYLWIVFRVWPVESPLEAVQVGTCWLLMTVAFEFLFARFVVGHSWEVLLADYNLLAGRVWIFVPVWLAIAPYVFYRWRG
jgi:hypothetical protein